MFDNVLSGSVPLWAGMIATAIAIPILIHLIRRLRHRTIAWAAMDFLLASHRKHRRRIWLKQWLLLLSRIAALLLALLLLAQIGCRDRPLGNLLGTERTHHYVLLDDSFSMGQRVSSGTIYDRALATVTKIAARAAARPDQSMTVIRFSRAAEAANPESIESNVELADLDNVMVDRDFGQRLEQQKTWWTVSAGAAGPAAAIDWVAERIGARPEEDAVVYVISDFRQRNWGSATQTTAQADVFGKSFPASVPVELIRCAPTDGSNVIISELRPTSHVRVADTPLMCEVSITNGSEQSVSDVQIDLESVEFQSPADGSRPAELDADRLNLPSILVRQLAPGESATRSFPVFFRTPGTHGLIARLREDAIEIDNRRYATVAVQPSSPVLVVDQAGVDAGAAFSLALNPDGNTGLAPVVVAADYLRDATAEQLSNYAVIFLLDIASLDEIAVERLEAYARAGGGVAFFTGPNIDPIRYRERLYRNGDGLFPVPLDRVVEIPEQVDPPVADIQPGSHPMFAPLRAARNSLLELVQIRSIWQPPPEWVANPDPQVDVLSTVRGNSSWPLVVEKPFGNGRVAALMTTADSRWNNWFRNATFVPTLLRLEDWLAAGRYPELVRNVDQPLIRRFSSQRYQAEGLDVFRDSENFRSDEVTFRLAADRQGWEAPVLIPDRPGWWESWLSEPDGQGEVRRVAVNVDPAEGQLPIADDTALGNQFPGPQSTIGDWDTFDPDPALQSTSTLSRWLLVFLVAVLIGEQGLAYANSYGSASARDRSSDRKRSSTSGRRGVRTGS